MAQRTQQMTEWIREGEQNKEIKQDTAVTMRIVENSSRWLLCTGCQCYRDVYSVVWFVFAQILLFGFFLPSSHLSFSFFFFNPEMYNDLSFEKCTFLCNLWAPGGLMNLCTYLCIANSICSLFIFGTHKESCKWEAQISSFPSLKLKQMKVGLSDIQQHNTWSGRLLKCKMFLQDCVKGLG